jgi:hypothetical protein
MIAESEFGQPLRLRSDDETNKKFLEKGSRKTILIQNLKKKIFFGSLGVLKFFCKILSKTLYFRVKHPIGLEHPVLKYIIRVESHHIR